MAMGTKTKTKTGVRNYHIILYLDINIFISNQSSRSDDV
jgi:hypothetical protein